jgi:60 kDa SS-A/Ro ribonucleoprotein
MARMNRKAPARPAPRTHEGGTASRIPKVIPGGRFDAEGKVVRVPIPRALEQLRRSVLACLLWEDSFYESGQDIAARITAAAQDVSLSELAGLAIEARSHYNLRSAPMLLLGTLVERAATEKVGYVREGRSVADAIELTVQRADELTELLAIYWRNGRKPLTAQLKKGLARAFRKFDAYQLAKYDRANAIRLRDVLFLTHPKPKVCALCDGTTGLGECGGCDGTGVDKVQAATWKSLVDGTLAAPDTWEVELSAGKDKRAVFERLLAEGKLGYLALLRNLRNMDQAGVDPSAIVANIVARKGARRVLPFRYVAAARAVPRFEPALDQALVASLSELPVLDGVTAVLVDVSGSMDAPLSGKSDLTRIDAAATLASIIPVGPTVGVSPTLGPTVGGSSLRVFTFSNQLKEVAPRRGMAGIDAVKNSQPHGGTYLRMASAELAKRVQYDRLIVITDEQSADGGAELRPGAKGYLLNVAGYQNGVNYEKGWVHMTGFSENILRFVAEYEKTEVAQ